MSASYAIVPYNRRFAERQQYDRDGNPVIDVAATAAGVAGFPGERASRFAFDRLPGFIRNFKGPGVRGVLGLGALGSVIAAGGQLFDDSKSPAERLGGAAGSTLGIPGAMGGAALGAALGGPLAPITGLIGGALGGALASQAGSQAGSGLASFLTGGNEDPQVAQMKRLGAAQTQLDVDRMRALMPLQAQAAEIAAQQEAARAALVSQRDREQAMAQLMLQGQQSSSQLEQLLAASILGGGLRA